MYAFTALDSSLGYIRSLYAIEPRILESYSDIHRENLLLAIRKLVDEGKISHSDRIIAVTDVQNGDKEIPAMEIIHIQDIIE